jgi:hypothetical protein
MTEETADFVAKLRQIEEQASVLAAEASLARSRLQHIVLLSKALRGRLEYGDMGVARLPVDAPPAASPRKPQP